MKFARKDLIDRIRAEITRREEAVTAKNVRLLADYVANRDEHVRRTGPAWNMFANTIKRRVRAGQPVTTADVPREIKSPWNDNAQPWDRTGPAQHVAEVGALQALLALLESTDAEEVTLATLDRIGFRVRDLFR